MSRIINIDAINELHKRKDIAEACIMSAVQRLEAEGDEEQTIAKGLYDSFQDFKEQLEQLEKQQSRKCG